MVNETLRGTRKRGGFQAAVSATGDDGPASQFRFEFQTATPTVIASAAKQSILPPRGEMDCFAALAMTA
jgi:hypothetical protein